tara:strand:- start:326 stop:517 length:192 start_codon:yes stop_codon:yes gene_type:complete
MEEMVRTLGTVKLKKFENNFDDIVDEYKEKAKNMGYNGDLRFKKEKGNMVILVTINGGVSSAG